jgi:hypothetical protein
LFLESIDGSGTLQGGIYVWGDSAGKLRYSSTRPTDENADGTMLDNTTIGGAASKALDNLASVGFTADIVPDADSTRDIGSSSAYVAEGYFDKLYLISGVTLTGSAGTCTFAGDWVAGASGTGSAATWYATTAGGYLKWDDTANSNAGGLIHTDDAQTIWGDASDFTAQWNGTDFVMDCKTANTGVFRIGSIVNTDIAIESQSSAGKDIYWDASAYTLRFLDTTILGFGTGGSSDYDIGLAYAAANTLSWTQKVAGTGSILKGVDGKGIDETWYAETTSDYMKWDQDGASNLGALIFEDSVIQVNGANVNYTMGISTDALVFTGTDHANNKITFGASGTTNATDVEFLAATAGDVVTFDAGAETWTFTDLPVLMTGANSSGTLLTIAGIDTTGNTDTVLIDHSGDGYAINIDLNEATSDGIKVEAFTNHTVPLILLDGDTAGFLGASNIGMLTIQNDIELTHVNSSALVIDVGTTKPKMLEQLSLKTLLKDTALES